MYYSSLGEIAMHENKRTHLRLWKRRAFKDIRNPGPCLRVFLELGQDLLRQLLLKRARCSMRYGTRGKGSPTHLLTSTRVKCHDHPVHERDIELFREVEYALRCGESRVSAGSMMDEAYLHGGKAIG